MNRIVITGLGLHTSLGSTLAENWQHVLNPLPQAPLLPRNVGDHRSDASLDRRHRFI